MKSKIFLLLTAFLLVFASSAQGSLVSTFDTGTEGWGLANDGSNLTWDTDGYIKAQDLGYGSYWYFYTVSWAGDWSEYIGGTLQYDIALLSGSGSYGRSYEVGIYSSSYGWMTSLLNSNEPALGEWTTYTMALVADSFNVSEATFDNIMSSVQQLRIRGEYIVGGDTEGLDNVMVDPVPEPATMLLLGSGLAGFAGLRRKLKKK